jgi:hypothetical protein
MTIAIVGLDVSADAVAGNTYLRYYLVEAANFRGPRHSLRDPLRMRIHCPEYRAYYQTKLAQSPRHAHKRALVLTARKLVRLLHALLRTKSLYQPPEQRQTPKEASTPTMQRPQRNRHTKLAAPVA